MKKFIIKNEWISLAQLDEILQSDTEVLLDASVKAEIERCRNYLDEKVKDHDQLIYGVNTGFGSLCNTPISSGELGQLQRNLVVSHACGLGDEVPVEIVRRMLLLKVLGLSHGNSGAQLATIERLLYFYNNGMTPVVYQQGSLGASGDLAPLAHTCLFHCWGRVKCMLMASEL